MCARVVEFDSVSRQFDNMLALDDVSFEVKEGLVYGMVGPNGAGKTTIIKHILGSLRAKQGRVRVFGIDPTFDPVQVLGRIGYLSEQRDLPEWMRIDELMWYTKAHYSNWDTSYCQELLETFALDPTKRIKDLSKGMRAQVALTAAVSHHPELLLLDEPSSGLDAVVRRDILSAVVRSVSDEGRTAIFSSHLLEEVERLSDYLLMVISGRVVLQGTVDEIRQQHHWYRVRREHNAVASPELGGLLFAEVQGQNWSLVVEGDKATIRSNLVAIQADVIESRAATLEEIYVARARRSTASASMESIPCPE